MSHWHEKLPDVRGRYQFQVPMAQHTWFQVGGAAEVIFRPADQEDVCHFLAHKPSDVPITFVGAGSNILVRDGGIKGIVIKLGKGFNTFEKRSDDHLYIGAGCLDRTAALKAAQQEVSGIEFLVGIPGMIGGAVKMNAGAYGTEMKDILIWADVIDFQGQSHRLTPSELGMRYRHTDLPPNWLVTGALIKGHKAPQQEILARHNEFLHQREDTQPVFMRTGGSTFRNPPGYKAWELIDQVGGRGLRLGNSQISEKHCNFLLNLGGATAQELENLGEKMRQKVLKEKGIDLQWEIIRLGQEIVNKVNG